MILTKAMYHLIVNPASAQGEKTLAEAEQNFKARGAEYDVFFSSAPGAIAREARRLSAMGEEYLIAVGGDGTLNEVLCGLEDPARVVLGLIPSGTGNDFASHAKIPHGGEAVDLILDGTPKYTDYLDCGGGRRSLNIAGLGIDVDILECIEKRKSEGKRCSYFKSLLISLMKYKPVAMKIVSDGEEREYKVLIAAACNGSQFGGGIPICPPAVIDDGKIDLIAVDCPKRIVLPYYLIKLMRGKLHTKRIYHRVLCEEAVILPQGTKSVQLDGELLPAEELRVRVVSGKLRMFRG